MRACTCVRNLVIVVGACLFKVKISRGWAPGRTLITDPGQQNAKVPESRLLLMLLWMNLKLRAKFT